MASSPAPSPLSAASGRVSRTLNWSQKLLSLRYRWFSVGCCLNIKFISSTKGITTHPDCDSQITLGRISHLATCPILSHTSTFNNSRPLQPSLPHSPNPRPKDPLSSCNISPSPSPPKIYSRYSLQASIAADFATKSQPSCAGARQKIAVAFVVTCREAK